MKKVLMLTVLTTAIALNFSNIVKAEDKAVIPEKIEQTKIETALPCEIKKLPPEEFIKAREAKKAEFEKRLKLSKKQKAKLDELKKEEQEKLAPVREEIRLAIEKEKAIKEEYMQKFEEILSTKQKEELKKIHEEIRADREKHRPCVGQPLPPMGPDGKPMPQMHKPETCPCPCHRTDIKK